MFHSKIVFVAWYVVIHFQVMHGCNWTPSQLLCRPGYVCFSLDCMKKWWTMRELHFSSTCLVSHKCNERKFLHNPNKQEIKVKQQRSGIKTVTEEFTVQVLAWNRNQTRLKGDQMMMDVNLFESALLTACLADQIQTLLILRSLMVKRPPELCQSMATFKKLSWRLLFS